MVVGVEITENIGVRTYRVGLYVKYRCFEQMI